MLARRPIFAAQLQRHAAAAFSETAMTRAAVVDEGVRETAT